VLFAGNAYVKVDSGSLTAPSTLYLLQCTAELLKITIALALADTAKASHDHIRSRAVSERLVITPSLLGSIIS
jgi:hypothetical protein